MNPLISIVTVVLDNRDLMARTLVSVLEQDRSLMEYIIIDGGSVDGTVELIKQNLEIVDHFVTEPDSGIYDAMNKGAGMCSGSYIQFLNAGDVFKSPMSVKSVADCMISFKPKILGCDVDMMDNKGLKIVRNYHASKWFAPWLIRIGVAPPHPGLFISKQVFVDCGGFDPSFKISGDFDLILRVLRTSSNSIKMFNEVVVEMIGGGMSNSGFRSYIISSQEISRSLKANGYKLGFLAWLRLPFKTIAKRL